ncbi:MAG: DUF4935 domain-containing protein [Sphingobacteriales bacterium]|uniref:PIN domain-containing protein n=1 Tax=uncultured Dysgonomonas sp. TaxID=206096 RepID=UPI000964264C|nr:PIN domain-containing protein [uncultured Dysgonomonas sp.]MBN8857031.1 DUF4935 domain-containing protein [Sphingobacteriales bacterium]OJY89339.1 MAG: hypothetical protein BGP14_05400 [Sphingobacteriales bacterium 44-15]
MTYLILDTNQWIYLANSRDPMNENFQEGYHFKLLEKLAALVISGKVKIVISNLINNEWERNKDKTEELIKKIENKRDSTVLQLKSLKDKMNGVIDKEANTIIDAITNKYNDEIEKNKSHIMQVEALLLGGEVYNVSAAIKAVVAEWALEKKAPFQKNNSMADALILFGAVEYIKSKPQRDWLDRSTYPDSIFISANKNDFSSPNNADKIHDDLTGVISSVGMKFSKSLPSALKLVDQFILLEEEIRLMEEDIEIWNSGESMHCLACEGTEENQFLNVVYFGNTIEISNEDPFKNITQIEIPFEDLRPVERKTKLIQVGSCFICATTHIKCSCGEIISLENAGDGEIFECEGCGTAFQTHYDHDGDGLFEERITLAPDDTQ